MCMRESRVCVTRANYSVYAQMTCMYVCVCMCGVCMCACTSIYMAKKLYYSEIHLKDIEICLSLSTVVLNSRDRYEKLWLPEFSHF